MTTNRRSPGESWRDAARTCAFLALAAAIVCAAPAIPASAQMTDAFRAEREQKLGSLFELLGAAEDPELAAAVEQRIWTEWMAYDNGDEEVSHLMAMALRAETLRDLEEAERLLTGILGIAPDFSEAWNRRATVRYLREDYEGSLADIDETLALEPRHFGALSGKALVMRELGDDDAAREALEIAVEIHPHLGSRAMLDELRAGNGADDAEAAQ